MKKVIELLRTDGFITNFYAIDNRISLRLGSIINRLRNKGWKITTEMQDNNCLYRLISEPDPKQEHLI